jgi:hypothetical protein
MEYNIGKEWKWMDEMEETNEIDDDKWDHYSGLPNPKWYEE